MTDAAAETVKLTRWLCASPKRVYEAWTDAAQFSQWLSPMPQIKVTHAQSEVRVGGTYRIGFTNPDNEQTNFVGGQYVELDPPNKLAMTWLWENNDDFPPEFAHQPTLVTVTLEAQNDGTQLTLTHQGLPAGAVTERHIWGWTGALDQLENRFNQ